MAKQIWHRVDTLLDYMTQVTSRPIEQELDKMVVVDGTRERKVASSQMWFKDPSKALGFALERQRAAVGHYQSCLKEAEGNLEELEDRWEKLKGDDDRDL